MLTITGPLRALATFGLLCAVLLLPSVGPSVLNAADPSRNQASSSIYYDIPLPDWIYQHQGNGDFSEARNCGPASVAMAVRVAKRQHLVPRPEDVRVHGSMGVGTLTSIEQLVRALGYYGVQHRIVDDLADLESAITERHHIVIALADMKKIPSTGSDFRYLTYQGVERCPAEGGCAVAGQCLEQAVLNRKSSETIKCLQWSQDRPWASAGRYNQYQGGHWLVVKGKVLNFVELFIAFDPNVFAGNAAYYYSDGTPKGRDRAYYVSEFAEAFESAGGQAIEVEASTDGLPSEPLTGSILPVVLKAPAQHAQPSALDDVTFLGHENHPPGSIFAPRQPVIKSWRLKNTGQTDIAYETSLTQVSGSQLSTIGPIKLTKCILLGEQVTLSIEVRAPTEPGTYSTEWRLVNSHGDPFGDVLPFDFTVKPVGSEPSTPPEAGRKTTPEFRGTVFDERGKRFSRQGTQWQSVNSGYEGHHWLTTREPSGATESSGKWLLNPTSRGRWEVFVYIPAGATTQSAHYALLHNGQEETIVIDQSAYADLWVSLGVFGFQAQGDEYLVLSSQTSDINATVAFDAVGIDWVGEEEGSVSELPLCGSLGLLVVAVGFCMAFKLGVSVH